MISPCLICDRIQAIKDGTNPYFVHEFETDYVVLGDYQFFEGYTLFLSKIHARELHELESEFREKNLWEMSMVAEAVFQAFHPQKLNYELLGNTDEHIHWHIFPRHKNDPLPARTVWNIDKEIRNAKSQKPSPAKLHKLKDKLKQSLKNIQK